MSRLNKSKDHKMNLDSHCVQTSINISLKSHKLSGTEQFSKNISPIKMALKSINTDLQEIESGNGGTNTSKR